MASKVSNVILCLLCWLLFVSWGHLLPCQRHQCRQGQVRRENLRLKVTSLQMIVSLIQKSDVWRKRFLSAGILRFRQYYFDPTLTKDRFNFNEGENLTIMDCEAKCFNNCSCLAYASTNLDFQTGCQIWSTRPSTATNYSEGDDMYKVIHLLEVRGKTN